MKKFIFTFMSTLIFIMSFGNVFADVYMPGIAPKDPTYAISSPLVMILSIATVVAPIIAFICFILGIVFMVKSKKSTVYRIIIGLTIIIVPIILYSILIFLY